MECKTLKDWEILKEFDAGYDCLDVNVYLYDSQEPLQAQVFVMALDKLENDELPKEKLPQERYVRVIATGMRRYGVEDEYIDYSILNVPYIPNRKPEEYLTFPKEKEKLKTISYNDYAKKAEKKAWYLIGNKVIQLGEHDPNSPFVQWITSRLVGKPDCTWTMLQTLYDPDLPVCESENDIQPLHVAWTENQMIEKFEQAELAGTVVGLIKEPAAKRSFKVSRLSESIKKLSIVKK